MADNYLKDKTLVITGAASGFGRLVAQMTASLGARVVAADVNVEGAQDVVEGINNTDGQAIAVACDVTDQAQMHGLISRAVETYGSVDIMINNAGVMPLAFFADHNSASAAWDRCIDINLKGVLHGMVAAYDQMIAQGRGHIVNLSSIYSNFPVAGAGVYGATKAAVNFLSESMRVESQGKIKVTVVRPTGVPTTNLATGVVNPEAVVGILGQNAGPYGQLMQAAATGELPPENTHRDYIEYMALEPEQLAGQIVHALNQPWGVVVSDITVRASGEGYVL